MLHINIYYVLIQFSKKKKNFLKRLKLIFSKKIYIFFIIIKIIKEINLIKNFFFFV
jgi:hypothetical protein